MSKDVRSVGFSGALLRQARRNRKVSREELADWLQVSSKTVGRWEADQFDPSPQQIAELAKMLSEEPAAFYDPAIRKPDDARWLEGDAWFERFTLEQLKQATQKALERLNFSVSALIEKTGLKRPRLNDLLLGKPPTAQELWRLRQGLGEEFKPGLEILEEAWQSNDGVALAGERTRRMVLDLQAVLRQRIELLEREVSRLTEFNRVLLTVVEQLAAAGNLDISQLSGLRLENGGES